MKTIQLLFVLFATATGLYAQPANDDLCGAHTLIPSMTGCQPFEDNTVNSVTSVFNATTSTIVSSFLCGEDPVSNIRDVWFKIPTSGATTIVRCQPIAGFNIFFKLYYRESGSCETNDLSLSGLNCYNSSGPGEADSAIIPGFLSIYDTIYLRVLQHGGGTGAAPINNSQFDICAYIPPPGCTTNFSPSDNESLVRLESLQWQSDPFVSSYDIYLGNTVATASLIGTTTNNFFSYTGPDLLPGTYFWYIVPKNGTIAASGCSSNASSFTILPRAPNDLRCNAVVIMPTVISSNPFSDPSAVSSTSNFNAAYTDDLFFAGQFVCASLTHVGADVWFKFTAPDSSLYTIKVNPVASINTSFRVWETTGCNDALVNKGCFNTGSFSVIDTVNIRPISGKEYFIQVFNHDGQPGFDPPGHSQFSIAVVKQMPGCPSSLLLSPANGATNVDHVNGSLSWNEVSNITNYDLYLGTTAGNMVKTNYTALQNGSNTPILNFFDNFLQGSPLSPGIQYFWKIVPRNNDLVNSNCIEEVRSFTTATCPLLNSAISSSTIQLNHAGELTYKIPCPNCPPSWLVLEYGPNASGGSGTNPAPGNYVVYPAQPVSLPNIPAGYAGVDSPHIASTYRWFIRTVGCATGSTQFLSFNPGAPISLSACEISEVRAGGGIGKWDFNGQYPVNSNGNATPGYMSWFNFTPTESGVYYLQVDSVSTTAYIDYLYKPDSLNRFSPSNWTGITEINAKGKYAIGYLTAGILYHFVADGASVAQQFIKICRADVGAPIVNNTCIEANIRKPIPAMSPKEEFAIDTAGRLIASIKAGAEPLGLVNVSYYVNANGLRYDANGREYLDRNYTITPSLPVSSLQQVKLYFRSQELTDLINAPDDGNADVNSINDLVVTKTDQPCSNSAAVSVNGNVFLILTDRGVYDATGGFVQVPVSSFSTFYLHGGNNFILPLRLLEFNGQKNNTYVSLYWKTTNEQNVSHFEVQRSLNGIDFISLGNVVAANTTGMHQYLFDDQHPHNGVNYYRLKQVDIDGRFSYSHIILVNMTGTGEELRSWPNPVSDMLSITGLKQNGVVQLFNADGRLLVEKHITNVSLVVDMRHFPAGIYLLKYVHDNKMIHKKIIKQ